MNSEPAYSALSEIWERIFFCGAEINFFEKKWKTKFRQDHDIQQLVGRLLALITARSLWIKVGNWCGDYNFTAEITMTIAQFQLRLLKYTKILVGCKSLWVCTCCRVEGGIGSLHFHLILNRSTLLLLTGRLLMMSKLFKITTSNLLLKKGNITSKMCCIYKYWTITIFSF